MRVLASPWYRRAMSTPEAVLEFWFPADPRRANALWWGKDAALDAEIRERFGPTLRAARAGELDAWAEAARGRLALIVVLDQMSRNIHRDSPEAFAADERARALTLTGLERGHDRELRPIERLFFYLPLEHSEALADQQRCVELMGALASEVEDAEREQFVGFVDYAVRHRDIIERFGRFPHRNAVLGRESTAAELEFLTQPGSSF
jgi:uncharacterized protein (DUF924 family)